MNFLKVFFVFLIAVGLVQVSWNPFQTLEPERIKRHFSGKETPEGICKLKCSLPTKMICEKCLKENKERLEKNKKLGIGYFKFFN